MKLGEYLQILHSYIGTDRDNWEFIPYLCILIMRPPHTPAEKKADEVEEYINQIASIALRRTCQSRKRDT